MNVSGNHPYSVKLSPSELGSLLAQIAEAEEQTKDHYFISVPGCFYEVEYGLLKGGGRGGFNLIFS